MKSFQHKVVVITGGSSGIGKATAESFYDKGGKVIIFGREPLKLQSVAEEFSGNITTVQGDVSKLSDLDRLYKTVIDSHGKIDVLVVNA